jgi:hypothetical protein
MKKIVVLLVGFCVYIPLSCSSSPASSQNSQSINPVIKISVRDLNLLNFWEWEKPDSIPDDTSTIKAISDVYIVQTSPEEGTIIIADEADAGTSMADSLNGKHTHWAEYSENIEGRYDKNKKYSIGLTLDIYKVEGNSYGLNSVAIDYIDDLISVEELARPDAIDSEKKRIADEAKEIEEEKRLAVQIDEEQALKEKILQKEENLQLKTSPS